MKEGDLKAKQGKGNMFDDDVTECNIIWFIRRNWTLHSLEIQRNARQGNKERRRK